MNTRKNIDAQYSEFSIDELYKKKVKYVTRAYPNTVGDRSFMSNSMELEKVTPTHIYLRYPRDNRGVLAGYPVTLPRDQWEHYWMPADSHALPSQENTTAQLEKLVDIANRYGLCDAADFIKEKLKT